VALLVSQFIQTTSIPSVSSPEVGLPVIRFLSFFDPTPKALEVMSIQNRTVNLGLVLETFNPLPIADALPSPPPPPSFIKGEKKMVKRKRGEEDVTQEQQLVTPAEPLKSLILAAKENPTTIEPLMKVKIVFRISGNT
jgi:hypothetical protein